MEVRKLSIEILAYLGSPEIVQVLIKILKTDKHIFVKQSAEASLQFIAREYNIIWTSAEALFANRDSIPWKE